MIANFRLKSPWQYLTWAECACRLCCDAMMGRSYVTVRALVLTVTLLVIIEYFSLMQSAENADKRAPVIFRLQDPGDRHRRHILQTLDPALYSSVKSPVIMAATVPQTTLRPPATTLRVNTSSQCPMIPASLHGRFPVQVSDIPSMADMMTMFPQLEPGGRWRPPNCTARHRVAVIVPYRDREPHLRAFLLNIHRFLQKQQIQYGVYIVEQAGNQPFNRAMLMNVGAAEAVKQHPDYQCYIFHDVDLLPEDDRNLYTCPIQPRHMSVSIDSFLYRLPYDDIFGGVSAMTVDQFKAVNGFSNLFWGWGGEDDDMANRLRLKKLFISRYPANIARYKMLKHGKEKANPERFKYLYSGAKRVGRDGLNSLKYKKVDFVLKKLYTWILVDLPHLKP